MRMNIHNVVSVEIEGIEELGSTTKVRTLTVVDANGNKYELTLFSKDSSALQIKA
jgi:hypothetical protein